MPYKLSITIARLLLVNLIPVIGFLFFEWKMAEVIIVYFLDLFAVFVALSINNYFLDRRTRYPAAAAAVMLLLSAIPVFIALILQASLLLGMDGFSHSLSDALARGGNKIDSFGAFAPLPWLIFIEVMAVLLIRKKAEHFYSEGYFQVFGKILIINLYLLAVGLPVVLLGLTDWIAIPVIVGFRLTLDIREVFLKLRQVRPGSRL